MTRRYPFASLAAAMGCSENQAVIRLGISGKQGQEYRHRGVTERAADRLAVRAGLHPAEVWPEWQDDSIALASVVCVECERQFLPVRRGVRFCGTNCRERRRMRIKYQSDPVWRERQLERRRAYYEDCADYEKDRARRRYWTDPEAHREARRERHHRAKDVAA